METITTRSLIQVVILTLFASQSNGAPVIAHRAAIPAPEVDTNPVGPTYTATLPAGAGVQGSLSGTANDDGHGTTWEASFTNLPATGGPFLWHIHTNPVPANGDCAGTGGRLDPFSVGDATVCDPNAPANCEIGDLSGKFGKITASPFSLSFDDLFISTDPANAAFVGSRSLTIHTADKKRIACASFVVEADDGGDDSVEDDSSDEGDDSGGGEDDSGVGEDAGDNEDAAAVKRATPLPPGVVPSPTAIAAHSPTQPAVPVTTPASAALSQDDGDDEEDGGDEEDGDDDDGEDGEDGEDDGDGDDDGDAEGDDGECPAEADE